jgi:hypothetical protein
VAVFRITSYTKKPNLAKKSIRYIAHRRDQNGQRVTRTLFGPDEVKSKKEAYKAIDTAAVRRGTRFFRMMISPDPITEDTKRDLDLREITEQTMLALQQQFPRQHIEFFAAIHPDHTDKRHVHIVAILQGRIPKSRLSLLRETATAAALSQRQELDAELTAAQILEQQQLRREELRASRSQGRGTQQTRTADPPPQRPQPVKRYVTPATKGGGGRGSYQGVVRFSSGSSRGGMQGALAEMPSCPNCGPGSLMQRSGRAFTCLSCGASVYRKNGMQLVAKRSRTLSLTLEEVAAA